MRHPNLGLVSRLRRRLEEHDHRPLCPACLKKIDRNSPQETVHGRAHHRDCARFVR